MTEETASCWIVQYRVKSRSAAWGKWTVHHDYRQEETALRTCEARRMATRRAERENPQGAKTEWRVLKVTQEVVY